MPELPEVQTIAKMLRPRLLGRRIDRVLLHRADILQFLSDAAQSDVANDAFLSGHLIHRQFTEISRRGKKIVFTLDDANRFYIHLGMTGRLTVEKQDAPVQPHTHLTLQFADEQLRFVDPRRFGGVFWLADTSPDDGLGPEPLTMRPAQLAGQLAGTKRPIKSALLDQSVVAGLGNIYVDESLFDAGIHPLTLTNRLTEDQIAKLTASIKQVLRRALKHRGSTLRDYRDANGDAGDFQKLHRVYQREGLPCLKCKSPIQRIVITGRSTHFCLKCQKRNSVK
jgi:formamidopyrimidine-DNA glycosylase